MPISDDQANKIVDALESIVKSGSMGAGAGSSSVSSDRKELKAKADKLKYDQENNRLTKEYGDLHKGLGKVLRNLSKKYEEHDKLITTAFTNSLENLSSEQFRNLPNLMKDMLQKTKYLNDIKMKSEEDVILFSKKREKYRQKVDEQIKLRGMTEHQLRINGDKTVKIFDELNQVTHTATEHIQNMALSNKSLTEKGTMLRDSLSDLRVNVIRLGETFGQTFASQMKFGTGMMNSLTSFTAGMNIDEMSKHLADNRRTINAAGLTMDEFREQTEKGTLGLVKMTGNLGDAVKVQAQAMETAKRFGSDDLQGFMQNQVKSFEKFHNIFSMTGEQFMEMNKQLKDSQAINSQIYRLNKNQRTQYIQETQQTVLRLRTMGLMQEQAMKVVEAMAELGGQSPKERLKQAAKLQAVSGAMGMGAEGAEAANLLRRGLRSKEDQTRFAELQQTMQKGMGNFMGQGLPQEMMASQMLERTGLEKILGPKSPFAVLNTEQTMATKDIVKATIKGNDTLGRIQGVLNQILTALNGPILGFLGSLVTIAGSILATIGTIKLFQKMNAGKNAAASAAGTGMSKGNLKSFRHAGAGLGAGAMGALTAGIAGWQIGSWINEAWEKKSPETHDAMQKTIGSMMDQAVSVLTLSSSKQSQKEFRDKLKNSRMLGIDKGLALESDFKNLTAKERQASTDKGYDKLGALQKKLHDEKEKGWLTRSQIEIEELKKSIAEQRAMLNVLNNIELELKDGKERTDKLKDAIITGNTDRKNIAEEAKKDDKKVRVMWNRVPQT